MSQLGHPASPVAWHLPITVIVPVLNEEKNIEACIRSLAPTQRVVVVDSNSTDQTVHLAKLHGAEVVQFTYVPGAGEKKKNWALRTLDIRTDWTMIVDADERVPPALWEEIRRRLSGGGADGYALDREFVFMNRQLQCFRPNWNMRLFRTGSACYENLGLHDLPETGDNEVHEHMILSGRLEYIHGAALLHEDYRGIGPWIDRHNRYATWEAAFYRQLLREPVLPTLLRSWRDPIARKRSLRRIWARLPCRPVLRFLIWYFIRSGFRSGRVGFQFCMLMAWYERLILIKMAELEEASEVHA